MIQAVAPTVAAAPLFAVPPLAVGYAALDGFASAHDEAIARGATQDQADKAGFENGAGQGALAALPVPGLKYGGQLVGKLVEKPLLKFFAKGATTASTTAAYGAASQATSNLVARENYDPGRPLDEGVGKAALMSGVVGIAGHGFGAVRDAQSGRISATNARAQLPAVEMDRGPGAPPDRPTSLQHRLPETGSPDASRRPLVTTAPAQPKAQVSAFDDIGAPLSHSPGPNSQRPTADVHQGGPDAGSSSLSTKEQIVNDWAAAKDFADLGRSAEPYVDASLTQGEAAAAPASPASPPWPSDDLGLIVREASPQSDRPALDVADPGNDVANDFVGQPVQPRKTWRQRIREALLGRTPDKFSRTGRQVVERMKSEGKIVGEGPLLRGNPHGLKLVLPDGTLRHIDHTIDMAHKEPAVSYWNKTGILHGKKSPEVRRYMLDPDNYELHPRELNRSEGGKIKETYKVPTPEDRELEGEPPDG